jgi:hypothetical protein
MDVEDLKFIEQRSEEHGDRATSKASSPPEGRICQCRDKTPAELPVLPAAVTSAWAGTR